MRNVFYTTCSLSINMYVKLLVWLTVLLDSCCFGVVASVDQRCYTFAYNDSSCPESWHYWGNSCYKITEMIFSWEDAKDECRNLGGVLATPSSDQENEFITQLLAVGMVWIDCNDKDVEGIWECREGNAEVAYRNWYDGEPNNDGDEDCAVVSIWNNKRQWHDLSCIHRSERAVCKMAGRPVLHV